MAKSQEDIEEENIEKIVHAELKESLRARLGNPFIASFIISWIILNWRFLLILAFEGGHISERISKVEAEYVNKLSMLWLPLAYSISFVVFEPWLRAGGLFIQTKAMRLCRVLNHKRDVSSEKDMELVNISNQVEIIEFKQKEEEARSKLNEAELASVKIEDDLKSLVKWKNDVGNWKAELEMIYKDEKKEMINRIIELESIQKNLQSENKVQELKLDNFKSYEKDDVATLAKMCGVNNATVKKIQSMNVLQKDDLIAELVESVNSKVASKSAKEISDSERLVRYPDAIFKNEKSEVSMPLPIFTDTKNVGQSLMAPGTGNTKTTH